MAELFKGYGYFWDNYKKTDKSIVEVLTDKEVSCLVQKFNGMDKRSVKRDLDFYQNSYRTPETIKKGRIVSKDFAINYAYMRGFDKPNREFKSAIDDGENIMAIFPDEKEIITQDVRWMVFYDSDKCSHSGGKYKGAEYLYVGTVQDAIDAFIKEGFTLKTRM